MRIVIALGRFAVARPGWTILGMLAASVTLAAFVPRAVTDDAIAVDNEPARALEVIDDRFGEPRTVVQILVSTDDAAVVALREQARERIPPEFAALVDELVGPGQPATRAMVLVFLDASGLDDEQALSLQRELATAVDAAELPEGFTAEAFSFALMLGDNDIGPEVGRLFGTALAIILVVLAVVYWVPPGADSASGSSVEPSPEPVGRWPDRR